VGLYQATIQRKGTRERGKGNARVTDYHSQTISGFFFGELRGLNEKYRGLFDANRDGDENKGIGAASQFIEIYGWLYSIHLLTNGRREQWDFYLNMNVVELFNTMTFFKHVGIYERQQAQRHGK
jgi:hypothetical protein